MARFSFKVPQVDISWADLAAIWREADASGLFDAGWVFDHLYPPRGPKLPVLEGWSLLASLAAITSRVRLGAMVSSNTFRHPVLLAKTAATIDQVSGGRLEIGLGAGWHEEEHADFGIDLPPAPARWARLAEALEIVDGLLTRETFSFAGDHFRIDDAASSLHGAQRPRPPLVIGGIGPRRTLPLVARWADQWNYFNPQATPDDLRERHARLVELCHDIGRDPSEIEVSVQLRYPGDAAEVAATAAGYLAAGAEHIVVTSFPPITPDAVLAVGAALADL